ncbi:two-component hybrid sensor and regulator [Gloeomargarita lithophora Alchichica-D10]|uniref:Circadian input-output histidine kinase CikA n=1 Tax=Gloeomargarita lithophora Alchichica-D10 TaxID=1188229 RepID=A0A1J0ADE2_9CYAN|nr:ATP-binding protein [Gloeomargarita lithophora]APB33954.1 two-component hybrid sensor and regulator [Gloeomargarita lithophora Alchichica-D10]
MRWPLRWVVTIPFVVVTTVATGLVGYLSFRNGQQSVQVVAQGLQTEIAERVQVELDNFLDFAPKLVAMNADLVQQNLIQIQPPRGELYFWRQMTLQPQLRAIYFGSATEGRFIGVRRRLEDNRLHLYFNTGMEFSLNNQGKKGVQASPLDPSRRYDARTRPWYQKALTQPEPVWTDVYVSFSTGRLAITAAQVVKTPQGRVVGATGADVELTRLSEFLGALRIGRSGEAFIVDPAGLVVADSTGDTMSLLQNRERVKATDSPHPMIQQAAQWLQENEGTKQATPEPVRVNLGGAAHFLHAVPYQDPRGLDWLLVLVVPEVDFLEGIYAGNILTAFLCGVTLVTALGLGLMLSRWFSQPVKRLVKATEAIAQGERGLQVPVGGVWELAQLAQSFNQMSQQLADSFTALETLNQDLEDRVEQRTQQVQASERQFRTLTSNIPGMVFRSQKLDGYDFVYLSDPIAQITGYSAPEFLNHQQQYWQLIIPEDQETVLTALLNSRVLGHTYTIEYRIQRADGQIVWVNERGQGAQCDTGEIRYRDGVIFDITQRKDFEQQLEEARQKAESANRAKSTFLANMSHELRTPLNAIIGFSQILNRDPQLSEKQRETVGTINRSGEHLLNLINDVLDMAKIEAGKLVLQPSSFDLHQMLKTIQDMLNVRAQAKNLRLVFEQSPDLPHAIETDENKLRQVLINLISNAIKFTKEGGVSVAVQALGQTETSCTLRFAVTDTGVGMTPDELKQLFQAFVQTDTSKKVSEGTGLGLAISRQFVQLMGGDITVTSEKGVGTTFSFTIQAQLSTVESVAELTPKTVKVVAPGQPEYRLLIVDDKLENRQVLKALLESIGLSSREATNGQEAVELWQTWQPHLIWMDLQMPVMNGLEATNYIKSHHSEIPKPIIIALSASVFEEEKRHALTVGFDDFVIKPYRETTIFAKLEQFLGLKFIYDTDSPNLPASSSASKLLTREDLQVLPADWLQEFHRAAVSLNSRKMNQLISQISDNHGELASTLKRMVKQVQIEPLIALTEALITG